MPLLSMPAVHMALWEPGHNPACTHCLSSKDRPCVMRTARNEQQHNDHHHLEQMALVLMHAANPPAFNTLYHIFIMPDSFASTQLTTIIMRAFNAVARW